MARGFGSTQGAGTTDQVLVAYPSDPNTKTISIWTTRNGNGAGAFTTPFSTPNVAYTFYHQVSNSSYNLAQFFAVGFHNWSFAQPSADAPHHLAIVYDNTSEANDPIIYIDGSVQVLTKTQVASGAPVVSTGAFLVGQTNGVGEWWDGVLSEFAVWRGLLSADRINQLVAGLSAAFVQPGDLLTYCPIWGFYAPEYQFIKNLQKSLVTGTTAKPHPIIAAEGIACAGQLVGVGY